MMLMRAIGLVLGCVLFALAPAGCAARREPTPEIAPSYSYRHPTMDHGSAEATTVARLAQGKGIQP